MKRFKLTWILTFGIILALPSLSILRAFSEAEACPEIVREALLTSKELCEQTGRNQACYGHSLLEAQPQPDIQEFNFENEGDVVDLIDLQGLRLEGMDLESGNWGVAMLRLQASLPDTEIKDNVTVLLFGDVEIENRVDETNADEYNPMQAFYFHSASDDSACAEAPESGMLIQTPEGVAKVSLLINEVSVELGSTVFFQTQEDGELTVRVVEGAAHVEGMGRASTAFAGSELTVPLDARMQMSGPPTNAKPYETEKVDPLPLELLEREVTVPPPLSPEEIEEKEEEATRSWTAEPTATRTPTRTHTLVPTKTPTRTPAPTNTLRPTLTFTPLPTFTLLPTLTSTSLPTDTPLPTETDVEPTEDVDDSTPSDTPDSATPSDEEGSQESPYETDTPTSTPTEYGGLASFLSETPTLTFTPTATLDSMNVDMDPTKTIETAAQ